MLSLRGVTVPLDLSQGSTKSQMGLLSSPACLLKLAFQGTRMSIQKNARAGIQGLHTLLALVALAGVIRVGAGSA